MEKATEFLSERILNTIILFKSNRTLKLHLNPAHHNVSMFFNLLINKKFISFHFFNRHTNIIASSYTELDDEEMDWAIRNNSLINNIGSNKDYPQLAYYMAGKIDTSENERLFKFNGSKSVAQSFIGDNQKIVRFLN